MSNVQIHLGRMLPFHELVNGRIAGGESIIWDNKKIAFRVGGIVHFEKYRVPGEIALRGRGVRPTSAIHPL